MVSAYETARLNSLRQQRRDLVNLISEKTGKIIPDPSGVDNLKKKLKQISREIERIEMAMARRNTHQIGAHHAV
jgi:hypothetical protein